MFEILRSILFVLPAVPTVRRPATSSRFPLVLEGGSCLQYSCTVLRRTSISSISTVQRGSTNCTLSSWYCTTLLLVHVATVLQSLYAQAHSLSSCLFPTHSTRSPHLGFTTGFPTATHACQCACTYTRVFTPHHNNSTLSHPSQSKTYRL